MKVKDTKEWIEFFNSDEMKGLRETLEIMDQFCPRMKGLKQPGYQKYDCKMNCLECWKNALNMEENQDKLENKI